MPGNWCFFAVDRGVLLKCLRSLVAGDRDSARKVILTEQIFEEARYLIKEFGMETVIRSFGQSKMGTLTWGNYPATLGRVKLPWQAQGTPT